MNVRSEIHALIYETNNSSARTLAHFFREIFVTYGYSVKFTIACGEKTAKTSELIADAEYVDTYNYDLLEDIDVLICDLCLYGEEGDIGLEIISNSKVRKPSLFVFAVSNWEVTLVQASNYEYSFDLFASKGLMGTEEFDTRYLKQIGSLFAEKFDSNVSMEIDLERCDFRGNTPSRATLKRYTEILRKLTFTGHFPGASNIHDVSLVVLKGGRSGSKVYHLTSYTADGVPCVSSVVKFSKFKEARIEWDNYCKYVKWYLPYSWRVELMAAAFCGDIGGLSYTFFGSKGSRGRQLTEDIEKGAFASVDFVVDNVFSPSNQRWYNEANIEDGENLAGFYANKWISKRAQEINSQFDVFLSRICGVHFHGKKLVATLAGTYDALHPKYMTSLPGRKSYKKFICHGDLNTGNILTTSEGQFSFIDFHDVSPAHVFLDFVVFESCFRLNYIEKFDDFHELFVEELKLFGIGDETCNLHYQHQILKVRENAYGNCPSEDPKNYALALCICCYSLFRREKLEPQIKRQLAACSLACSYYYHNC